MSSDESTAPTWDPPPATPKPTADEASVGATRQSVQRIAFLDSLRFIFSNPEWIKGVLMGALCLLLFVCVLVLSQLIIFGYSYEIVELLHRRKTTSYPLFDFRRFMVYVKRGVWPFLISFMVQSVLQPVLQFSIQGPVMGTMIVMERDETIGMIVAAVVFPTILIFLLVLTIGLTLILTPVLLRAGLSQDFAQAFKFTWIKDFVQKMWLETVLVNLYMVFTSTILVLLGCVLFCFPGMMVAMALSIAGAHLNWQLYELYLARGGEPIPLKPLPADVPPVAAAPTSQA